MSDEGSTDVEAYARTMHESGRAMARSVLDDARAVVLAFTLDSAGMPRRFVLLRVSDGSVALDLAADPGAESGPLAYAAVLETLDLAVGHLGLVRTTGSGPFKQTTASIAVWDPRAAQLAVRRLLHRDGAVLTRRESRLYPWIDARWLWAGSSFAMWYAEPAPEPQATRGGALGAAVMSAVLRNRYSASSQQLPDASGDALADARQILAVLRGVADGTAPVSPRFPG